MSIRIADAKASNSEQHCVTRLFELPVTQQTATRWGFSDSTREAYLVGLFLADARYGFFTGVIR